VPRNIEDSPSSGVFAGLNDIASGAQDMFWRVGQSDWFVPLSVSLSVMLVLALVLRRHRQAGIHRKPCRWKKDPRRLDATLIRWHCMTCGVDAFTADGSGPKECKRDLRETAL